MVTPARQHGRAASGAPITRITYCTMKEPLDVLYRIQRGLSGYVSYLAACEMNPAFSEYVLYEPVLRILTARGYRVTCEYPCPGLERAGRGDKKKIDFRAVRRGCDLAIEVKWARTARISIQEDFLKLQAFRKHFLGSTCCLCVFGRKSHIKNVDLKKDAFAEILRPVYAEFGRTRYGCRIYELATSNNSVE